MDTPSTPGAASSTPAVTPAATPVSSPASSTPVSTPASTPAAPAAPGGGAPTPIAADDKRSNEQIIADRLKGAYDPDGVGGSPNPNPPTGDEDIPGDNGDVTVPPAGNEDDRAAEAAAAAAAAAAEDADQPFNDFSIDTPSDFGPEALSAALQNDPTASAALEANPELKAAVFANARKAQRAEKYDAILGSPDEAQVAVAGHQAFTSVSNLIGSVQVDKPDTIQSAIDAMVQQTVLRDENGNTLMEADGVTPRTDGSVGRLFKGWFMDRLAMMAVEAKSKGDEDGLVMVDGIMERAGLRPPSRPNEDDLSPELREREQALELREKALQTEQQQAYDRSLSAMDSRVHTKTDAHLDKSITTILGKATGLDDFSRSAADAKIRKEFKAMVIANPVIKSELRRIDKMPVGAKREAEALALNTRIINDYLGRAARKVLTEAGASVVSRTQDRNATQAARERAAQSESRGSLPPTSAAAAQPASLQQVETELTATLGRRPSTQELLAERMKRSGGVAA